MGIKIRDITDEVKTDSQKRRVKKQPRRRYKGQYGSNYTCNSGFSNMGDATHYYHATKGWRRRHTIDGKTMSGVTLMNLLLIRGDIIGAARQHDAEGIKAARAAHDALMARAVQ